MNSFGHIAGEVASLPLSAPCTSPHPWPLPSASASAPSVRDQFFIGDMQLLSTPNPNPIDLAPGRSEIPSRSLVPLSLLSRSLAPPLARWSGGAARRRPEQDVWWRSPGYSVLSFTSSGRMVG